MHPRILVIGAGAIGSLVAGHLAQSRAQVTLVGRSATERAIRYHGLRLSEADVTMVVHDLEVVSSLAAAFLDRQDYQLAILAVKSYDTNQVVSELVTVTDSPPPVLTLQNGVGNEEILVAQLGQQRVIAGVIATPTSLLEPGHVLVDRPLKHVGLANLGQPVSGFLHAQQLSDLFEQAGFKGRSYRDWRSLKWTKLIMNLLCNASCALLGWPPQKVWSVPELARLELTAWREAITVIQRLGCHMVNFAGYPLGLVQPLLRGLPDSVLRRPVGYFVLGGRGGKMPSLYVDLSRGKGRSEVRWLNGAVVRAAATLALPVPANQVLYESLSAVVEGQESWDRFRNQPATLLASWLAQDKVSRRRQDQN
jgi:2-dehydropantoate 2-reductase